jgi:hypothetical protein
VCICVTKSFMPASCSGVALMTTSTPSPITFEIRVGYEDSDFDKDIFLERKPRHFAVNPDQIGLFISHGPNLRAPSLISPSVYLLVTCGPYKNRLFKPRFSIMTLLENQVTCHSFTSGDYDQASTLRSNLSFGCDYRWNVFPGNPWLDRTLSFSQGFQRSKS